jgi:hypothetical protein
MELPLSDEEREALAVFLNEAIADELHPLSPRLKSLKSILVKLDAPQRGKAEAATVAHRG